jgi:transposase-like protein
MDERVLTIKGERHYLWRAVDQDGTVLDILVQRRRNKRAAKQFFRKLLKGVTYAPRVIVPDGTVPKLPCHLLSLSCGEAVSSLATLVSARRHP